MGFLQAVQYTPAVLFGLFAGVWVDRLPRKPILIGSDLGRAVLLLALPVAAALSILHLTMLYVVAFLLGVLGVFFDTAYMAFLPSLVQREALIDANSKLATSESVAGIAGPGLAGVLVQAFTAPVAVTVDAVSFLISALTLGSVRGTEARPSDSDRPRENIWTEIGEGLEALRDSPVLRAFVLSSSTLDIFWNALMAVYVLYIIHDLGFSAGVVGLIFGVGSIGALLGFLIAGRAAKHLGVGHAIVGAQLLLGAGGLLIALTAGMPSVALPLLIAAELVQSTMNAVYTINRISLTQVITPARLLGRLGASTRCLGLGAVTLGALLGGLLGNRLGLATTVVLCSSGSVLAFLWLFFSPLRSLRELPTVSHNP